MMGSAGRLWFLNTANCIFPSTQARVAGYFWVVVQFCESDGEFADGVIPKSRVFTSGTRACPERSRREARMSRKPPLFKLTHYLFLESEEAIAKIF
jgi:hypothetical protein